MVLERKTSIEVPSFLRRKPSKDEFSILTSLLFLLLFFIPMMCYADRSALELLDTDLTKANFDLINNYPWMVNAVQQIRTWSGYITLGTISLGPVFTLPYMGAKGFFDRVHDLKSAPLNLSGTLSTGSADDILDILLSKIFDLRKWTEYGEAGENPVLGLTADDTWLDYVIKTLKSKIGIAIIALALANGTYDACILYTADAANVALEVYKDKALREGAEILLKKEYRYKSSLDFANTEESRTKKRILNEMIYNIVSTAQSPDSLDIDAIGGSLENQLSDLNDRIYVGIKLLTGEDEVIEYLNEESMPEELDTIGSSSGEVKRITSQEEVWKKVGYKTIITKNNIKSYNNAEYWRLSALPGMDSAIKTDPNLKDSYVVLALYYNRSSTETETDIFKPKDKNDSTKKQN